MIDLVYLRGDGKVSIVCDVELAKTLANVMKNEAMDEFNDYPPTDASAASVHEKLGEWRKVVEVLQEAEKAAAEAGEQHNA